MESFHCLTERLPSPAQLKGCVAAYAQNGVADSTALEILHQTRIELVSWVGQQDESTLAENFAGSFSDYADIYISSIFVLAPLCETGQALRDYALEMLSGPEKVRAVIMLSLLQPAWKQPLPDLDDISEWYLNDFIFYAMRHYKLLNDADALPAIISHYKFFLSHVLDYRQRPKPRHDLQNLFLLCLHNTNMVNVYADSGVNRDLWGLQAQIAETYLQLSGARLAGPVLSPAATGDRKLRIGILAHNFAASAEGYFAFSHWHDLPRDHYDLTLFSFAPEPGGLEHYAARRADAYVTLDCLNPKEGDLFRVVETIRAARLDVLIIATNVSASLYFMIMVASHRMASLQLLNSATPVPTGFHSIDGFLSGTFNESSDGQNDYPCRLMMVDGSVNYYAYHLDQLDATDLFTRERLGLPTNKKLVFANGNFFKLTPDLLRVWARIMAACPMAHLVMMPFTPGWQGGIMPGGPLRDTYRQLALEEGANPDGLSILDEVPVRADRHQIMALCSVYLDCFPFAGACSMLDPFLVGMPIVVRSVPHFRGLLSTAMLRECGLDEMAADSDDAYIQRAIRLIQDDAFNATETARVRAVRDAGLPFFDTVRYGRKLEVVLDSALTERHRKDSALLHQPVAVLDDYLQDILARLDPASNPLLAGLDKEQLMTCFIAGYYLNQPQKPPGYMIDVGGFVGIICRPLLAQGWMVDLFEPDPACADLLNQLRKTFSGQLGVFHAAIGSEHGVMTPFYLSDAGLSGFQPNPYSDRADAVDVPCFRLDAFSAEIAADKKVDVLKIHADGCGFAVLESFGWDVIDPANRPDWMLVHIDSHFAPQSIADIITGINTMRGRGYKALIFSCQDDTPKFTDRWQWAVRQISTDIMHPDTDGALIGHILFFRDDDVGIHAWILRQLAGFMHDCDRPEWA